MEINRDFIKSSEFTQLAAQCPVPVIHKAKANPILALEITDKCNYSCPYCFEGQSCNNQNILNFDTACKAIDELPDGSELRFFGGEPLLQFPLIVRLVERYPSHIYSLVTNGSPLTQEMAAFFASKHFAVGLSYDGKDWQQKQRPSPSGNSHQDFRHAMAIFEDVGLEVGISTVVTKESLPFLYDIHLEVFADFQVKGWAYLLAYSSDLNFADLDILQNQILQIVIEFPTAHLLRINDLKKWAMKASGEWPIDGYCGAGSCYTTLSVHGEKRICPFFLREDSCYGPTLRTVEVDCKQCFIWEYCKGGCYSINRSGSGNTHKSHPFACKRNHVYFEMGLATYIKIRRDMIR
jgi:sulfatase maturation enzyme AslB (radical SAM superfamily)